jgi:hypothetical protein
MKTADRELLLMEAVSAYREIEALYRLMLSSFSAPASHLSLEKTAKLDELMRKAGSLDTRIAETLHSSERISGTAAQLLQERKKTLDTILQHNRALADKAANIKALLGHEISSMSKNRNAIRGYKSPGPQKRQMIKGSC